MLGVLCQGFMSYVGTFNDIIFATVVTEPKLLAILLHAECAHMLET